MEQVPTCLYCVVLESPDLSTNWGGSHTINFLFICSHSLCLSFLQYNSAWFSYSQTFIKQFKNQPNTTRSLDYYPISHFSYKENLLDTVSTSPSVSLLLLKARFVQKSCVLPAELPSILQIKSAFSFRWWFILLTGVLRLYHAQPHNQCKNKLCQYMKFQGKSHACQFSVYILNT